MPGAIPEFIGAPYRLYNGISSATKRISAAQHASDGRHDAENLRVAAPEAQPGWPPERSATTQFRCQKVSMITRPLLYRAMRRLDAAGGDRAPYTAKMFARCGGRLIGDDANDVNVSQPDDSRRNATPRKQFRHATGRYTYRHPQK